MKAIFSNGYYILIKYEIVVHKREYSKVMENTQGHGVSGSTLSSLKQGQGFDPSLCMENLSWGALYPSVGRPGASVD